MPLNRPRLGPICALVVAALLAGSSVHAQSKPIRFDSLFVEQGLSQGTVLNIFQDSRGFMWFGTENGLNRYDGYSFTVFKHDPDDPRSLPNDFVFAIDEDASGDLWMATEGGGVARRHRDTGRFSRVAELDDDRVRKLLVDRDGKVWIGTRDAGIDRLDPRTGEVHHYRHSEGDPGSLADDAVFALYEDRGGTIWVGTSGGLSRFEPETDGFVSYRHDPSDPHSLSGNLVLSIVEGRSGRLWVGTREHGLNRLEHETGRFRRYRHDPEKPYSLSNDKVDALLSDDAGRLWVGTVSGLDLRQPAGPGFSHYRHDPANPRSLSDDSVMSLHQDRGGVLWVGTRNGGVNKWNPATWSFGHHAMDPSDPHGLSESNVTSFTEDAAGRLWAGTFGGGLNLLDRETGRFTHLRHDPNDSRSLSDDRVMALLRDPQGRIWVGTFRGGLNVFDPTTRRFKTYRHDPADPRSLGSNAVMSLFNDSSGALWVGTYAGGLNRLENEDGRFTAYRHDPADPSSLSSDVVTCVVEDSSGALWVGTDGGGLNVFDRRTGKFRHFRHDPAERSSLSSDTVYSLYLDDAEKLWVGNRSGGLDVLDVPTWRQGPGRPRFSSYSERQGLPSDQVYGILPGAHGRLWLSTNNGLSRFDPASGEVRNFNESHGVQGAEFHFGAYYASPGGELFFGGQRGFNAFFPERLESNAHVPPVALTAFLKLNKPVSLTQPVDRLSNLELSYRDDVVTFEFAALDYAAPEENRYAYKLEGFDPAWIDLGGIHRVTYTDLSHGDYNFRVRAANNDGVWNEAGLTLPIRVVPPPWRTWWAHVFYVLALAGAVYSFVRYQQRKVEREAEYSRRLEAEVRDRTQELVEQNVRLEELNTQLAEASLTDSLTGFRNRRFLFEEVARDAALIQRGHATHKGDPQAELSHLIFVMVDLDHFKPVNDTCGHAAGDQVLLQVRDVLTQACRSSDILIRWGGDEFLVVGREVDLLKADIVPERIRAMIERQPFDVGNGQVAHLSCSIGFTQYPFVSSEPHALSLDQAVALADKALYIAKNNGRNAWVGFLATQKTGAEEALALLRDDPLALHEQGRIEVRTSIDTAERGLVWS